MLSLVPGAKHLALHAVYPLTNGVKVPRNEIRPEHFAGWVDYAREKGIGLDFNPTYFSHPMLRDNWTLASPEKEVRDFWVQHGIACRKIGEYFGRELGEVCITNHWIPDGSKDTRVDTLGPRERLVESLDRIFAEPLDRKYNRDSIEGKVFGLGLESYTAGSHEFYTNYALTTGKAMVCMDTGHYHPTESVAAKLSSYFVFGQEIMTHLSRAVRWDSDHVATVSEDTVAIMQEIKRCNAFDKVHLGLDFFDASIDRVSASVIGARSVKKALMIALLEPTDKLMEAEREGNFTRRLALLEEFKMLPAGIVFDEYCRRHDMPGAGLGGEALSRRFIIDTDTGSDDAWAIVEALCAEDIARVEAITTVCGNFPLDLCTKNALLAEDAAGGYLPPVYRGVEHPLLSQKSFAAYHVHGEDGLGGLDLPAPARKAEKKHAVPAIIDLVRENPGEIEIITIGPLTNIAVALTLAPDLVRKIKKLWILGGSAGIRGNLTECAEYNVGSDPEAAEIVLQSGAPAVWITLDTTRGSTEITPDEVERLARVAVSGGAVLRARHAAAA